MGEEGQGVLEASQSPTPTPATQEDLSPQKGFGEKVFGTQMYREHARGQDSISETPEEAPRETTSREGTSVERTPEEMVEIRKQLLEETRAMLPYSKEDGTPFTNDERSQIIAAAYKRLGDASVAIAESAYGGEAIDPLAAERVLFLKFALVDYEYRGLRGQAESSLPKQLQEIYRKMDLSTRNTRPIIPWIDSVGKISNVAPYREHQSQQDRGPKGNFPGQVESSASAPQIKDASDQQDPTGNPPQT